MQVGEAEEVDRFVREAVEWAGEDGIYGVVNNAGVAQAGILASFPNVESEKILASICWARSRWRARVSQHL